MDLSRISHLQPLQSSEASMLMVHCAVGTRLVCIDTYDYESALTKFHCCFEGFLYRFRTVVYVIEIYSASES